MPHETCISCQKSFRDKETGRLRCIEMEDMAGGDIVFVSVNDTCDEYEESDK